MARLGLDAETCAALNPRLVYVSLPGFASTEPDAARRGVAAWEGVVLADAGVFRDMGLNRQLRGIAASYTPLPLASAYASVLGALGATLALRSRAANGGRGDIVEVPLAAALLDGLSHNSLSFPCPERHVCARSRALRAAPPSLSYDEVKELLDPFWASYECADGRPFYLVAPGHGPHQQRTLAALGLTKVAARLGVPLASPYATSGGHSGAAPHAGIGGSSVGQPWAAPLRAAISAAFLRRSAFEWEVALGAARVPCAAHRTAAEWARSSHVRESGLLVPAPPGAGCVRSPAPIAWVRREAVALPPEVKFTAGATPAVEPTAGAEVALMAGAAPDDDHVAPRELQARSHN